MTISAMTLSRDTDISSEARCRVAVGPEKVYMRFENGSAHL
jgi:hypothetical protein